MSRPTLRILSALLALSAAACANPTAPAPTRASFAPSTGASFDDTTPPPRDSTCRSGYMTGQGFTC